MRRTAGTEALPTFQRTVTAVPSWYTSFEETPSSSRDTLSRCEDCGIPGTSYTVYPVVWTDSCFRFGSSLSAIAGLIVLECHSIPGTTAY